MAGCFKALGFWKKKSKGASAAVPEEKRRHAEIKILSPNPEKPPVEVGHVHNTLPPGGVPVRPHVNPEYSAYSTPVDTTWADSTTSTKAPGSVDDPADSDAVARRKKAEQEEQERLDFFQMM
ncbi:predicted protein [Chaetomium globosum CBS 148.51]|uniref:Uncharacterized protein n=1 Tax=Chaetomium globosum (strain ATCC 6205 / CBS 148.51 / DSM 1962 / NBRC 6347 / NRRL 1970) TaxID=306901 RepID=Q2GZE3_CHAGB|nr:uncharacterized protein CHGG_05103 [Chaetomium globosum CBS 148.51]EAQ88484.1 predicted protein [Chaetomium globosum CBS 148.51]